MAIFEKERASRRYYSLSTDAYPVVAGANTPAGSMLTYTDTGAKFIYDGKLWQPFAGGEGDTDVLAALDDMKEVLYQLLRHIEVIRAAMASVANDLLEGDYPPED